MKQKSKKTKQSAGWLLVPCVIIFISMQGYGPRTSDYVETAIERRINRNSEPDAVDADQIPSFRVSEAELARPAAPQEIPITEPSQVNYIGRCAVQVGAGFIVGFGLGAAGYCATQAFNVKSTKPFADAGKLESDGAKPAIVNSTKTASVVGAGVSGAILTASTAATIASWTSKDDNKVVDAVFAGSDAADAFITNRSHTTPADRGTKNVMRTLYTVGTFIGAGASIKQYSGAIGLGISF